VTFQALQAGNLARNVYLTSQVAGAATTLAEVLYATGVTAGSYNLSIAAPTNSYAVSPPFSMNSTGLAYLDPSGNVQDKAVQLVRAGKRGNLEDAYRFVTSELSNWNHGDPQTFPAIIQKLRHAHAVFNVLAQCCADIGTLIDANAGTLGSTQTGIGNRQGKRTWP
jgi:hypothetical protein